jgi:hypothetical protein
MKTTPMSIVIPAADFVVAPVIACVVIVDFIIEDLTVDIITQSCSCVQRAFGFYQTKVSNRAYENKYSAAK